jgi:hypothetical protein
MQESEYVYNVLLLLFITVYEEETLWSGMIL